MVRKDISNRLLYPAGRQAPAVSILSQAKLEPRSDSCVIAQLRKYENRQRRQKDASYEVSKPHQRKRAAAAGSFGVHDEKNPLGKRTA